jgi:hypothetical protein
MARARRKSTAPILLVKALTLAAKRLGVNDLDYVKIRLREQLKTAVYGRDCGVQAVHPPDARVDALWSDPLGGWEIRWEQSRAERCILVVSGIDVASERQYAVGLWIAPAVIAALAPVIPKPRKPSGRPSKYREPLEQAARKVIKTHGRLPLEAKDGSSLLEKVTDLVGVDNMPERTQALDILRPINNAASPRREIIRKRSN